MQEQKNVEEINELKPEWENEEQQTNEEDITWLLGQDLTAFVQILQRTLDEISDLELEEWSNRLIERVNTRERENEEQRNRFEENIETIEQDLMILSQIIQKIINERTNTIERNIENLSLNNEAQNTNEDEEITEEEIENLENEIQELETEIQNQENEIQVLESEIQELENQIQELSQESENEIRNERHERLVRRIGIPLIINIIQTSLRTDEPDPLIEQWVIRLQARRNIRARNQEEREETELE